MVVPGIAGRHTIAHFHGALPPRPAGTPEAKPGVRDRRAWSEAVARDVGVDAILACTINSRRELAGLWVGDLVHALSGAPVQFVGSIREFLVVALVGCHWTNPRSGRPEATKLAGA